MKIQHNSGALQNALSVFNDTIVIGDLNKPDVQVMIQELKAEGLKVVSKHEFDSLTVH